MGENIIQSVGSNDSDPRGTAMYQMFQNQLFKTSDSAAPVGVVQPEKTDKSAKPEKVEEKPAQSLLPITNNDTFLKFMVDKKTNDITVYVVDRASHRVMRSIPPTDVNNLKAGDLLKLLA
ncbi:MAG: flagellar protein FlaG [Chloroflexota bacterium]